MSAAALAMEENKPIHFSGDEQVWDRKTNQIELYGHAAVTQPGETLTADYIHLDKNTRTLVAKGNCVYISGETFMWGDRMEFDLNTRMGRITAGRVTNTKFSLRGEVIDKVGPGHFKAKWGYYTTCVDCPDSWGILSEDLDMEMEQYAYFTNVIPHLKGAPALWFPYLVMPLKTQRQSGFLTPTYSFSGDSGLKLLLPYFWAMDRNLDMTFSLGWYTRRGPHFSWEGRYIARDQGTGTAMLNYQLDRRSLVKDSLPSVHLMHRGAFSLIQEDNLGWGVQEKLRLSEVTDNIYPFIFPTDVLGSGEAFLPSILSFSKSSDSYSTYLSFHRYRNLLNSTSGNLSEQAIGFDPKTVQVFPRAAVSLNDYFFDDGPVAAGLALNFSNFTRAAGGYDFDQSWTSGFVQPTYFRPGQDPIRKAVRLSVTPSLYTSFRMFDVISVVPSMQYRGYFYNFGEYASPLARGYLLFQADLTTQFEKIIEYPETPDIPRVKHLIRPLLNYSLIPMRNEDQSHPFSQQITRGLKNNTSGYYFDNNDIVPYSYTPSSARFILPLGHSLSYGLTSQWVRRMGKVTDFNPTYKTTVEWSAGQAIDLIEAFNPADPGNSHSMTRFFSNLILDMNRFTASTTYNYYPDAPASDSRHTLSVTGSYIMERSVHQGVMDFDRSLSLSYNFSQVINPQSNLTGTLVYSLSDYLMPTLSINYDFSVKKLVGGNSGLRLQSPARCWWIFWGVGYTVATGEMSYAMDFKLNLTGSGFSSMSEMQQQIAPTTPR